MKLKKSLTAFGVVTIAVSALATGPAAFALDSAPSDSNGAVVESVAPQAIASTMGVYDLLVKPNSGAAFDIGSVGKATFNLQPATGSRTGAIMPKNSFFQFSITLPKGLSLEAGGNCADSNNGFWGYTCTSVVNAAGQTIVTYKITRTGNAEPGAQWSGRTPFTFNVKAAAGLSTNAKVVVDYTPVAGYTSSSASAEAALSVVSHFVLETPASGALVREDKPTFSGTGDEGASIEVLDENGDLLAPATTVVDGKWSAVPTDALAQGRHIGTIRQVSNGTESTVPFDFTYRVVQGVSVTAPALDGTVDVARPVFKGKGEPGAAVTVVDSNDQKLVDTTVNEHGDWEQQSLFTLSKGAHEATATQTFNGVPTTAPVRFSYETPATPVVVTTPTNGSVVDSTVVRFVGTGEPGARVVVAGATKEICSVEVGTDGSWSCDSTIDLPAGDYAFTATQTRGASVSHAAINFTRVVKSNTAQDVKFTAPANNGIVTSLKPIFTGTGEPGAAIRVHGTTKDLATTMVKPDGTWEATSTVELTDKMKYELTVTQTPTNQAPKSTDRVLFTVNYRLSEDVKVTTPANGSTVAQKKPVFTGTGDAGSTITIAGTTKTIAIAHVDEHGNWSTPSDIDLANGDYKFSVKQVDVNGELKETAVTFTVKTTK
ncbi:Ig-like domain-containing protein [Plantibacter sp. YIM 135249]|uniref:Ig-like domain-containing protein n=1 Tax=Plantibacter sp. YIM 135249 TaxID=3423918 RepID=UPI003D34822F